MLSALGLLHVQSLKVRGVITGVFRWVKAYMLSVICPLWLWIFRLIRQLSYLVTIDYAPVSNYIMSIIARLVMEFLNRVKKIAIFYPKQYHVTWNSNFIWKINFCNVQPPTSIISKVVIIHEKKFYLKFHPLLTLNLEARIF